MRRTVSGPIKYPLYLAGLATSMCGVAALNVGLADKSFAMLTGSLLCVGYGVSALLRRSGRTTRFLELAVIAAAIAIYIQVVAGGDIANSLLPATLVDSPEIQLASVLLWLEILRSFTLVSDESVVFSAIPSVVMVSLATTSDLNPEIMAIFVVYLILAVFLLTQRPGNTLAPRNSFRIAFATALAALGIGCLVVIPIRILCIATFKKAMPGFSQMKEHALPMLANTDDYLQIAQGPVQLTEKVVLTVHIDSDKDDFIGDIYWRGRVFDRYTGHGWEATGFYTPTAGLHTTKTAYGHDMWEFNADAKPHGRRLKQTFELSPFLDSTIYAAGEPSAIKCQTRILRRDGFNCWQGNVGYHNARAYEVISELPIVAPKVLRKTRIIDYYNRVPERFLRLRFSEAHQQVGNLARQVTKGLGGPYDKARAIERYLGQHYTYDLEAPPVPVTADDAVEYFLFKSKRGYCDVFASSMVVMCREVGVPARLATGFITGELDSVNKKYIVREKDRHAWAEVYFPDCGWVAFDPTSYTMDGDQTVSGTFGKSIARLINDIFGGTAAIPATILLLVICAMMAFGKDIRRFRFGSGINAPSKLHGAAVGRYYSICKTIGARSKSYTPFEAVALTETLSPEARSIAIQAMDLFSKIRYAQRSVTEEDIRQLRNLHREIKAAMKAQNRRNRQSRSN